MAKTRNRPERLSRKDMEDLIKSGQSIIHDGQMITRCEDLPTEVDLALGDPAKENETEANIDRQIASLQAAKAQLEAGRQAKAESKPDAAHLETNPPKPAPADEPSKAVTPEHSPSPAPSPADDKAAQRAKILGETKAK